MITVRKEWKNISSDEEMLQWAKKWGALLMETWNNPIYTAGHTEGKKEILTQLDQVAEGNIPQAAPVQVQNYAEALNVISQNLKILSFTLKSSLKIEEETLRSVAASEMAKKLADFIEIDVEYKDEIHYHFNLVMVE